MWHVWRAGYIPTEYQMEKSEERRRLEDLGINGSVLLKRILYKEDGRA